jgi:hypothetical protein
VVSVINSLRDKVNLARFWAIFHSFFVLNSAPPTYGGLPSHRERETL